MGKRDIYLSDDLARDVKAGVEAGDLNVSTLCQPVLGYAVLHGQQATEDALRRALVPAAPDHAQAVDREQLSRIEQLATTHHEDLGQLRGRLDTLEQRPEAAGTEPPGWVKIFATLALAISCIAIYMVATRRPAVA
jgi:hypothetical protein